MKIVHICLCGAMTDGWNYQENILSKYHKKMGYEVTIIASQWIWGEEGKIIRTLKREYDDDNGVHVIRIPTVAGNVDRRLKVYRGLYGTIQKENPDVLFIHDCQFLDILTLAKYAKRHPKVTVYVDNHVDYTNGAHGWLSKNILHKGLWRYCAKRMEPYVSKFYGVLPARVQFLKELYHLPEDKCELLIMGADDDIVEQVKEPLVRAKLRERYQISEDDFLVVSGGKINSYRPETIELMKAINNLENVNIKLLIFGEVSEKYAKQFNECLGSTRIIYAGWVNSNKTYEYLAAADLVVFPGLHSVMWEQTVALGVPAVFRDIDGFHHVDVGGNAVFIKDTNENALAGTIMNIYNDKEKYAKMKNIAETYGKNTFSYRNIAKRSIAEDDEMK